MQGQSQGLLSLAYPKLGTATYSKPLTASWPPKAIRNKSDNHRLWIYFEQTSTSFRLQKPDPAKEKPSLIWCWARCNFAQPRRSRWEYRPPPGFCRSQVKAQTPSSIRILPLVFYPKSLSSRFSGSRLLRSSRWSNSAGRWDYLTD